MTLTKVPCVRCNKEDTVDFRYLYSTQHGGYQLEMHCEGYRGGCDFYRVLPLYILEDDLNE